MWNLLVTLNNNLNLVMFYQYYMKSWPQLYVFLLFSHCFNVIERNNHKIVMKKCIETIKSI